MNKKFDFNEAVKELLAGKKISGKDGVLAPLVKQLIVKWGQATFK